MRLRGARCRRAVTVVYRVCGSFDHFGTRPHVNSATCGALFCDVSWKTTAAGVRPELF